MRILLIDECGRQREAFRTAMAGLSCQITECQDAIEAETILASDAEFDVLVVDQRAQAAVAVVRQLRGVERPVVVLGECPQADANLDHLPLQGHFLARHGAYHRLLPQVLREVMDVQRERRLRLQAQQMSRESQMRLQQIVDGSSVATFVIDQNHVVTHWNRACAILTGKSAQEMVGRCEQWQAFYSERRPVMADLVLDGALQKDVERFYHGKFRPSALIMGAVEAEDFFPSLGDQGRWLYFTAAPLRDTDGEVIGAIETLQDVTERHRAEEALRRSEERYRLLAITDSLTGLFNSRHFYDQLHGEMARAIRHERPLSLIHMDVDNFKRFNDTYGHLEGDRVLECLADVIRSCLRREDSGYRLGGEEFGILVPETDADHTHQLAERLRLTFAAQCFTPAGCKVCSSISIGVTQYRPGEDATAFIRRADDATYRAKHQGKNRVVVAA